MAATDPIMNAILLTDIHSSGTSDTSVPLPESTSIPDSNNILAEFSMYTPVMNMPMTLPEDAPFLRFEGSHSGFFGAASSKQDMKRAFPRGDNPWCKKARTVKSGYAALTEPVTPNTRSEPRPFGLSETPAPAPLSPASRSVCTVANEVASMPLTVVPADSSVLPSLWKEQTARRRAMRKAVLRRSRFRKEEGLSVVKCEPSKTDSSMKPTGEPLDKKAARAIRNREAAMRSRAEAKQKMKKLQDENESLTSQVKTLSEKNHELATQMKNLLQYTLGVQVAEGQDIKEAFSAFCSHA